MQNKVEHVFTFKFADKWERPLRKWVDKCLDLSKQYSESFHFIAVGIGSYFFLLGVSKVVEASNRSRNSDDNIAKRNRTKTKTEKSKESGDTNAESNSLSRNAKTKDTETTAQLKSSTIPKAASADAPILD